MKRDSKSVYSTNLSSAQICRVLNKLLVEGLYPAIEHSDLVYEIALSCLTVAAKGKRVISGIENDEFMDLCFTQLVVCAANEHTNKNKIETLEQLIQAGLERNVLAEYLTKLTIVPTRFDVAIDQTMYMAHAKNYLQLYETFRRDLVNRFYNLTEVTAKKNHYLKSRFGLSAEEEEHFNVHVLSLMKAIDKFVPFRGTITSYINKWFENAKGSSPYMVYTDEAFSITRSTRKQVHDGTVKLNNKVIPLDDKLNNIEDLEASIEESSDFLNNVARMPNSTLLFFALGLPYYPKSR